MWAAALDALQRAPRSSMLLLAVCSTVCAATAAMLALRHFCRHSAPAPQRMPHRVVLVQEWVTANRGLLGIAVPVRSAALARLSCPLLQDANVIYEIGPPGRVADPVDVKLPPEYQRRMQGTCISPIRRPQDGCQAELPKVDDAAAQSLSAFNLPPALAIPAPRNAYPVSEVLREDTWV